MGVKTNAPSLNIVLEPDPIAVAHGKRLLIYRGIAAVAVGDHELLRQRSPPCRLHHDGFHRGWIAVDEADRVLIPRAKTEKSVAEHVLMPAQFAPKKWVQGEIEPCRYFLFWS